MTVDAAQANKLALNAGTDDASQMAVIFDEQTLEHTREDATRDIGRATSGSAGLDTLSKTLTGKSFAALSPAQQAKIRQLQRDVQKGAIAPKFVFADGAGGGTMAGAGPALMKGVSGAYVLGRAGTRGKVYLSRNLSGSERQATVREEYGEAIAARAKDLGINVAEGDAGARVLGAVEGKDVSSAAYKADTSDNTFVTIDGKRVAAKARKSKTAAASAQSKEGSREKGILREFAEVKLTGHDHVIVEQYDAKTDQWVEIAEKKKGGKPKTVYAEVYTSGAPKVRVRNVSQDNVINLDSPNVQKRADMSLVRFEERPKGTKAYRKDDPNRSDVVVKFSRKSPVSPEDRRKTSKADYVVTRGSHTEVTHYAKVALRADGTAAYKNLLIKDADGKWRPIVDLHGKGFIVNPEEKKSKKKYKEKITVEIPYNSKDGFPEIGFKTSKNDIVVVGKGKRRNNNWKGTAADFKTTVDLPNLWNPFARNAGKVHIRYKTQEVEQVPANFTKAEDHKAAKADTVGDPWEAVNNEPPLDPNDKNLVDRALSEADRRASAVEDMVEGKIPAGLPAVVKEFENDKQAKADGKLDADKAFEEWGGQERLVEETKKDPTLTFKYNFEPSIDTSFATDTYGHGSGQSLSQTRPIFQVTREISVGGDWETKYSFGFRYWSDTGWKKPANEVTRAFEKSSGWALQEVNTILVPLKQNANNHLEIDGDKDITKTTFFGFTLNGVFGAKETVQAMARVPGHLMRAIGFGNDDGDAGSEALPGPDIENPDNGVDAILADPANDVDDHEDIVEDLNDPDGEAAQSYATQIVDRMRRVGINFRDKTDINARGGLGVFVTTNLSKIYKEGSAFDKVMSVASELGGIAHAVGGGIAGSYLASRLAQYSGNNIAEVYSDMRRKVAIGGAAAQAALVGGSLGYFGARGFVENVKLGGYAYVALRPFGAIGNPDPINQGPDVPPQVEGGPQPPVQGKDKYQFGRFRLQNFVSGTATVYSRDKSKDEAKPKDEL